MARGPCQSDPHGSASTDFDVTRRCTVCSHADRDLIDAVIVGQAAYRRIATLHGLTEASVRRHAAAHLPATLALATEATEASRADVLLAQAEALRADALDLLNEAREKGDLRAAVSAVGQARGVLELLARLAGELSDTTVNVVVSAEWAELRTLVVQTLDPWPEARAALAAVLSETER
jgi:hypothetical protein